VKLSCADRIVVVCGLLLSLFCFSAAVAAVTTAAMATATITVAATVVATAVVTTDVAAAAKQNSVPCERLSSRGPFSLL